VTQTLRTANALFARLRPVYTDDLELSHTAPVHATANGFLNGIPEVFCIMVHETDGSVARNRARSWYDDYRRAGGSGGGPQLVVWADGTVMSLVELPYRTTHGNSQNGRAIGVETGHGNDGRFGDVDVAPDVRAGVHPARQGWAALSANANDVAGSTEAKFFALHAVYHPPAHPPAGYPALQSEVVTALWSTAGYQTPARERPGTQQAGMYNTLTAHGGHPAPQPTVMLFTEWHYRSWALLTRYLCEALLVPRNFPLLPHARRDHAITDETVFKRLVLADERFDMLVAGLRGNYLGVNLAFAPADFTGATPADATNLRNHYRGAVAAPGTINFGSAQHPLPNVRLNVAWLRFFDFYRGIHGHGLSGNQIAGQDDHDCPGPMFDWHRYAREVWDWWWWPFDFDAAHARTDLAPERQYRRADGSTPLVEYFFNEAAAPYRARAAAPGGIQGPGSSPMTFRLEQNTPIYALANGELVAARYPRAGATSMAFVLVRHEIFHQRDPGGEARAGGVVDPRSPWDGGRADIGRLDYDTDPSTVYTLYMHLGRHNQMSFDHVDDHNPDWLNRVLIRLAECDLALPPATPGTLHPQLNAWRADLTQPPSEAGGRPTPLEAWQTDQADYRRFVRRLADGDVAVAPFRALLDTTGPTPVRVILGDYLGVAGVIRQQAGVPTHGVRVEVFSPAALPDPFFTIERGQTAWNPAAGNQHPALFYRSEWSFVELTTAERAELTAIGVDTTMVNWWSDVSARMFWDVITPVTAKLPADGRVFHYDPIDFMQWLNNLTWTSEWPKYRVRAGGAAAARPAAPRPRRV
jgi:hypothetical protein